MEKLFTEMMIYVIGSLIHNWLPLSLAILTAAIMIVYVKPEKLKQALLRKTKFSVPASVAVGAFTPLCACGTMAVIIGMLTTALPWGPIMAFLTSSPLMSPDGFILVAGIISLKFAIALALASVVIGLSSGYLTHLIEKKTNFLKDQVRFVKKPVRQKSKKEIETCGCSGSVPISLETPVFNQNEIDFSVRSSSDIPSQECCIRLCCISSDTLRYSDKTFYFDFMLLSIANNITMKLKEFFRRISLWITNIKWREIAKTLVNIGVKQILLYYSIFVTVGFLINHFIPASIIVTLFSVKNVFAVPLAALIGLPIYVNGESALPLIQTLMASGASGGAMLAFLITGPGTSAGVITGIATIMKKRAIILYILFLLVGGIFLGYLYDLFLAIGV